MCHTDEVCLPAIASQRHSSRRLRLRCPSLPLIPTAIAHVGDGHKDRLDDPEDEQDGVPQGTEEGVNEVVHEI